MLTGVKYLTVAANGNHARAKLMLLLVNNVELDANGWYQLGCDYRDGTLILNKEPELSRASFEMAANLQHEDAITVLLKLNHNENVVKRNKYNEAFLWRSDSFYEAELWYQTGMLYDQGRGGSLQDYVKARLCYVIAITKNPVHTKAQFALGLLYENGLGVKLDLPKAKLYFIEAQKIVGITFSWDSASCRVISNSPLYEDAAYHLAVVTLRIDNKDLNTSAQWLALAEKYMEKYDLLRARICYQCVIELAPLSSLSHARLGLIYDQGLGVPANTATALKYFNQVTTTEAKENTVIYQAIKRRILIVNDKLKTADEWYSLGYNHLGDNNYDHAFSIICYEIALTFDPNHLSSLQLLGLLHYDKHILAPYYLKRALNIQPNDTWTLEHLIPLEHPELEVCQSKSWVELGVKYWLEGYSSKPEYHYRSFICLKKALTLDGDNPSCNEVLGKHHHKGLGTPVNLDAALECYKRVIKVEPHKEHLILEILESKIVYSRFDANAWYQMGSEYYYGQNDKKIDQVLARLCFEQTLVNYSMHERAAFYLALIYHYGLDVPVNKDKACKLYRTVLLINPAHEEAKKAIFELSRALSTTPGTLFAVSNWRNDNPEVNSEKCRIS